MLAAGTIVERYVVESMLGRGGMAVVYAVRHRILGTRHALKVLSAGGAGLAERLLREGRAQASFEHPNVLPVRDVLDIHGSLALLMPLVEGPTLRELQRRQPPTLPASARLLAGIASGLSAVHDRGFVHRDLKPENVLLDLRYGEVVPRVADFGLVKALTGERGPGSRQETVHGAFMGTPAYAAPEQFADASDVGPEADRWALGCIAFELALGRQAFPTLESLEAGARRRDHLPDLSELPGDWARCVRELWAGRIPDLATLESAPLRLDSWAFEASAGGPATDETLAGPPSGRTETSPPDRLGHRTDLPAERDTFVGRQSELQALADRFRNGARLTTLAGIGGCGKTRLAVRFAAAHQALWPGGTVYCDLTNAHSAGELAGAVARAMDVPTGNDAIAQLGRVMASAGRALLILDNFEQLVGHAESTVGQWMEMAPQLCFLVTSRVVLGIAGESTYPLEPLPTEAAVALFEQRGRGANSAFRVDEDNRQVIETLVQQLDGLPLAIELAAVRLRVLTPPQILSRLSDRFRLLATKGNTTARHATLRAALESSWSALEPWEQAALAQVSVFDGGFTLEAAESVVDLDAWTDAPWVLDVLQSLIDKSLVRPAPTGDRVRFNCLVSVDAFGREMLESDESLGGLDRIRIRHGQYYSQFGTRERISSLKMRGGTERRRALDAELSNILTACRRALKRHDLETAGLTLEVGWALMEYAGPYELIHQLALEVKNAYEAAGRDLGGLHIVYAASLLYVGDLQGTSEALVEARREAERTRYGYLEANVEGAAGVMQWYLGDLKAAESLLERALEISTRDGDPVSQGLWLHYLGATVCDQGHSERGVELLERGVRLSTEIGDDFRLVHCIGNLGCQWMTQGHLDRAERHFEQGIDLAEDIGAHVARSWLAACISEASLLRGTTDWAEQLAKRAMKLAKRIGHPRLIARAAALLGSVALNQGRYGVAREKLTSATHQARQLQHVTAELHGELELARLDLEQARHREAADRLDRIDTLAQGTPYLLSVGILRAAQARAFAGLAEPERAKSALTEAQSIAEQILAGPNSELGQHLAAARNSLTAEHAQHDTEVDGAEQEG